jgi:O-antigen/teichoic acid export membrane protein
MRAHRGSAGSHGTLVTRPSSTRGPLAGAGSVLSGVVGAGFFTYLFLGLAGRTLGPEEMAPVSTLWAMVFIVGPGLFLPAQQELARILGGQRDVRGGRSGARRVSVAVGVVALAAVTAGLLARTWVTDRLLSGSEALFWCFLGAVVAFAVNYVTRGVLAGLGDFRSLGLIQALESLLRLVISAMCVLSGWRSAVVFGVALAVAPVLAALVVSRAGRRLRLTRGTPVGWREAGTAVSWLLLASFMMQLLANAGPIAVQLQTEDGEQEVVAEFFGALVIARAALFLFQALQATVLPNLAELIATGRAAEVRHAIRRLVWLCLGLTLVSTLAAYLLGGVALRLLFGPGYEVDPRTMAVLAAASSIQVMGIALSGAAIAARAYVINALGWLIGCVTFAGAMALPGDVFVRVESAYFLGCLASTTVLLLGTWWRLAGSARLTKASSSRAEGDHSTPEGSARRD